jgi:hypothetical protein
MKSNIQIILYSVIAYIIKKFVVFENFHAKKITLKN